MFKISVQMSTIVLAVFATLLSLAQELPPDIQRVEPPFWWQGFEHGQLQILIQAKGISAFDAAVDTVGISVNRVVRGDSPNYLFVYLDIAPAAPIGEFVIRLSHGDVTVQHRYALHERNDQDDFIRGFSSSDVIYLITPDRFANGDKLNDEVPGLVDLPDRSKPFGRHGGDIKGISDHLDYIADMGFTTIWVNPVLENAMPEASYHGYATTDFYRVDPRFGSNKEYRRLVADARRRGLGFIMDMIVNHAGVEHWWQSDIPTNDWINFDGKFHSTSHARTTNQDPYASDYDKKEFADGWFAPSMPDLNQRNPLLADYIIQNSIWWTEYLGLAGIRQDTYPYPDKQFMTQWTRRLMQEYPDLNIVGEEWSPNPVIVSYWQAGKQNHDGYQSYLPSVMDFPLQMSLAKALTDEEPPWGSVWTPVYEMLGNDFLYPDPFKLVIFADNHDMSRIYTQVGEDFDLYRMAMVYYLTMRGIPQIYYGTEILMSHPGTDSHGEIRSDFPGGWDGDRHNAFTDKGLSKEARRAQKFMRKLLNWRKTSDVIHHGKLMQFAPVGNVYSYFRYNDQDTVMVIFNRGRDTQSVDLSRFSERIGERTRAVDIISGQRYNLKRDLLLKPNSVLLLSVENQ